MREFERSENSRWWMKGRKERKSEREGKKRGKRNYEIIGTAGPGTRWKGWRKGRSEVNTTRAVHRATEAGRCERSAKRLAEGKKTTKYARYDREGGKEGHTTTTSQGKIQR